MAWNFWPFRKKQPEIVQLGAMLRSMELVRRAMIQKDPDYYREAGIGDMRPPDGRHKWREKYPNDLVSEIVSESIIHPN